MIFNTKYTNQLPVELVNIIADFRDYDKYCLPKHKTLLNDVLYDIVDMSKIMETLHPMIAWQFWGIGRTKMYRRFSLKMNI